MLWYYTVNCTISLQADTWYRVDHCQAMVHTTLVSPYYKQQGKLSLWLPIAFSLPVPEFQTEKQHFKFSVKSKRWQYHSHLKSGHCALPSFHSSSEKHPHLCSSARSRYRFTQAEERGADKEGHTCPHPHSTQIPVTHSTQWLPQPTLVSQVRTWHNHKCPVCSLFLLQREFRKKKFINVLVSFSSYPLDVSATLLTLSWPLLGCHISFCQSSSPPEHIYWLVVLCKNKYLNANISISIFYSFNQIKDTNRVNLQGIWEIFLGV